MAAHIDRSAERERHFYCRIKERACLIARLNCISNGPTVAVLKKIVIFGVGLIGGSFALALRKAGAVEQIVGVGRTETSLKRALELGLIDVASTSIEEALRNADLVLLSVPVAQTEAVLASIKPYLQLKTIITDAGSIKGEVVNAARRALGEKIAQFIPGHPIAGLESSGPDAAIADLYVGKKIVLTPLPENTAEQIRLVTDAWQNCGAIVHQLTAEKHDAVFAAISHLPHLLAFALVDEVANKPDADLLFQYAASGFRDTTRLAGSSPEMWRDIGLANQHAILNELDAYIAQLIRFRGQVAAKDGDAMQTMFANAQRARQDWLRSIETAEGQNKQSDEA
jgi:prephenate dehydrogenase